MSRVLCDASAIIALARIGELECLEALVGVVHVPPEVADELLHPEHPERVAVEAAVTAGWLRILEKRRPPEGVAAFGLGRGEASLFAVARPGDLLILDDLPARRLALARGLRMTGLLGLLVAGVEGGALGRVDGLRILDALARGTFHMTVELYQAVRERMEQA